MEKFISELEKYGMEVTEVVTSMTYPLLIITGQLEGIAAAAVFEYNCVMLPKGIWNDFQDGNKVAGELISHELEHLVRGVAEYDIATLTRWEELGKLYKEEEQAINAKVAPTLYEAYEAMDDFNMELIQAGLLALDAKKLNSYLEKFEAALPDAMKEMITQRINQLG